jgi:hypothetical protein
MAAPAPRWPLPTSNARSGPSWSPSAPPRPRRSPACIVEKASIEGQRKVAEADLGPVRYLATLLDAGDQDVLRWFILIVALLLDPAAVMSLLAATSARR